jgi:hypothetical protein
LRDTTQSQAYCKFEPSNKNALEAFECQEGVDCIDYRAGTDQNLKRTPIVGLMLFLCCVYPLATPSYTALYMAPA